MRNLRTKSKKVLSFAIALLMIVSTIFVCDMQAKADETILKELVLTFDAKELSFEVGASDIVVSDSFMTGEFDGYMVDFWTAHNPDTKEEIYHSMEDRGEEYVLNETDEYRLHFAYVFSKDGTYFSKELTLSYNMFKVTEELSIFDFAFPDSSAPYGDTIDNIEIHLGTGAEILAAIENANNPQEPSESESQEPSESESQEPSESESQEPSESESEEPSESESEEPSEEENDHSAKLESDVASKVELTEDEKTAIANGDKLEVVLGFKDAGATATTDEQKAIEKDLGDKKLGTFLDIDLTKKIGTTEVAVSETTGLVTITFELPANLKNTDEKVTRTYSVMRYHDGKVDTLNAKYDADKGTISFETDKFSTYAVVYSDVTTTPGMGDASAMFLVYLVLGAGLIVVASRKKARI